MAPEDVGHIAVVVLPTGEAAPAAEVEGVQAPGAMPLPAVEVEVEVAAPRPVARDAAAAVDQQAPPPSLFRRNTDTRSSMAEHLSRIADKPN